MNIYKLGSSDFIKGAITAIAAGAVVAIGTLLHGVFGAPNFDVFSIDWVSLGHDMINATVIGAEGGFSGYIVKNFFSDQNGAVLGKWGGTKDVESK